MSAMASLPQYRGQSGYLAVPVAPAKLLHQQREGGGYAH
jgi:hypothetical protein